MSLKRTFAGVFLIYALVLPTVTLAQTAVYTAPKDVIDKIKDEGMTRSQVMPTLSYLSDVIGPRLTASPGMKRANEWTRDTLSKWGMANAHLEPWGPFGRGWTLKKFYAMVDGPTAFPLLAYPKAWSPGTDTLIAASTTSEKPGKKGAMSAIPAAITGYTAEVVKFNPTNDAELEQFKGKLKGKIVLLGAIRELKPHFDPDVRRNTDKDLLNLADAPDPATVQRPQGNPNAQNPQFATFAQQQQFNAKRFRFLSEEGAAVIVDGARGDYGTIFVAQATAVQPPPAAQGAPPNPTVRVWDKGATVPVQVSVASEQFNRIERMIDAGENVKMTVDLNVEFQDADPNGYNTVAEIPGTDKADEIVMLGGHLDSWHAGTGATDNGAGVAVMMEAMRIIKSLGLQPRRTIRIGLWTGEEEGLLGSREYVKDHFGWMGPNRPPLFNAGGFGGAPQQPLSLTKGKEWDKLSSYFNIDNGTGRIRGIYMQGNDAVRPIFKAWFEPFRDPHWFNKDTELGAYTLSMSNTGGTDHLSYDAVGLPGFQFIQDPLDYDSRTHHSNMDVFDRVQADDMKQIATIVAAFVYQAAMMDGQMPKKGKR